MALGPCAMPERRVTLGTGHAYALCTAQPYSSLSFVASIAATAGELPLAMSSAVLPSLFFAVSEAPCASSIFATAGWLVRAVFMSGVAPMAFVQSTVAPCSRSSAAISGKPRQAQRLYMGRGLTK